MYSIIGVNEVGLLKSYLVVSSHLSRSFIALKSAPVMYLPIVELFSLKGRMDWLVHAANRTLSLIQISRLTGTAEANLDAPRLVLTFTT